MSLANIHKVIRHLAFIKKPRLALRILNGFANTLIFRKNVLRSIEFAVTYNCQAKCHKCYSATLAEDPRPVMTKEQIKNVVEQALKLGLIHINITGGEPTLRQDIPEIIEICHPDEIMVSLVTNAASLTKGKLAQYKASGLNTIQISLDSSDPNTHDALRGIPGCFDKAVQAGRWAREMGINLCFSTVLSTESSSNMAAILKLKDLAVEEKAFLLICDSGSVGRWEGQGEKMMTGAERDSALEYLMGFPNTRHHNMYNFRAVVSCPAGIEKIYITAHGDVTPCDLIHDSFGNVLKEPLEGIWKRMATHPLYSKIMHGCPRYTDEFKYRNEGKANAHTAGITP